MQDKRPVFCAGFSDGLDMSGMAWHAHPREFVKSRNGIQLADTGWGQLAKKEDRMGDSKNDRLGAPIEAGRFVFF